MEIHESLYLTISPLSEIKILEEPLNGLLIPLASYDEILIWNQENFFFLPCKGAEPSSRVHITKNYLYIFGIRHGHYKDSYEYTFSSSEWEKIPEPIFEIINSALLFKSDKIYLFGGAPEMTKPLLGGIHSQEFSLSAKSWKAFPNLNTPRMNSAVCEWNSRIYIIGGRATETAKLSTIEEFSEESCEWRVIITRLCRVSHLSAVPFDENILIFTPEKEIYCFDCVCENAELIFSLDVSVGENLVCNSNPLVTRN